MKKYTVVHLFSGSGGCTLGFQRAGLRSLGSFDCDAKACRDLARLTTPVFCVDLQAMKPAELAAYTHGECPDVVVGSPPCKSFSGCMPAARATEGPTLSVRARAPDREERHVDVAPWLRLAAIRAGKDWRDLPPEIVIGGDASARHAGKMGVEQWDGEAHTVTGAGNRVVSGWSAVADPRLAERAQRQNGGFGVEDFQGSARAVLGEGSVRNTPASVADPRVHRGEGEPGSWGAKGHPDHFGVGVWTDTAPTVRGRQEVQTSRTSVADPRPRNGHYGVIESDKPAGTVIGYHAHDRAPASVADPRLDYSPRRGSFGVVDDGEAAPVVRGCHDVRQAPAAVVDPRGWPTPTHQLVQGADGRLMLYGPPLDLKSKRPVFLVIRAPDGTWHRPMTDRELAVLQGFPADCILDGPSSSGKGTPGRREHIGNAIPAPAAEAFGREVVATLAASDAGEVRLLAGGDIWVEPEERAAV